jgi:hypothetical protein
VFRLVGSHEVYGYEEVSSGARVIGKFYGSRHGVDRERAAALAAREYRLLSTLRGYGLVGSPHHVVRPLALAPDINGVLAVEYYGGESLSGAITRSIRDGDDGRLGDRLTALASYLACQHNRTAAEDTVDFDVECRYFSTLVATVHGRGLVDVDGRDELEWLRERWRERPRMWQDRQVWLHGDATPANFLFGAGMDVAAIDLERMRRGDRVFDVGRVAGELHHAFLLADVRHRAETLVTRFLWEYCGHFPDQPSAFDAVSARTPFYRGLNLLRIARNRYITPDQGHRLVHEAKLLLRVP